MVCTYPDPSRHCVYNMQGVEDPMPNASLAPTAVYAMLDPEASSLPGAIGEAQAASDKVAIAAAIVAHTRDRDPFETVFKNFIGLYWLSWGAGRNMSVAGFRSVA
jgi:hypothetical protein